jgi:hypothetical protein
MNGETYRLLPCTDALVAHPGQDTSSPELLPKYLLSVHTTNVTESKARRNEPSEESTASPETDDIGAYGFVCFQLGRAECFLGEDGDDPADS